MRILKINDNNQKYLKYLKKNYKFELQDRNLKLKYQKTKNFLIKLYNYDGNLSFKTTSKNKIEEILNVIDNMIMRQREIDEKVFRGEYVSDYSKRKDPRTLCFPKTDLRISHCFSDSTHHTCCMLGPKARNYSNISGNPIGKVSEEISNTIEKYYPWCTCTGSQVCSYYANKFNDGTRIKFMYNPKNGAIYYNVPFNLEKDLAKKFEIGFHRTPGIK